MATSSSAIESDATFNSFYCEVKQIEKQDAVLTSAQQIERLLRPGATYRNLNPFEVLQIDPDLPVQDLKKKYKRMSILVHPDKNPDDRERAQTAFDIINKAYKALEDENTRKKCMDVVEEAKFKVDSAIADKRKKLKKEGRKDAAVDEDDPDKYKRAIQVQTMKLFADMERKRKELETRDQEERKRKREAEIEEEENKKAQKEWNKNFEAMAPPCKMALL
ncbi:dnaJ homolog subfamily C member 8-like isoform X2 [Amphibalanus amphitrite]|uniref:dnaJ homolog subfamily C member 8-like isoform X2 n=1 Tax=Amphibalanus amphitrite TaxID=1232801 RepID=UPI001C908416|nr:dnaJ homolog subfamily C member 8-like isoform X2 [Amphibalanus amphitrite]